MKSYSALTHASDWTLLTRIGYSTGYRFAGLQYAFECRCSNSDSEYSKHGTDKRCTSHCEGDKSQICGGNERNSVYRVGEALS